MYRNILIIIVLGLLYSCESRESECQKDIELFISNVKVNKIDDLYGFSAESIWAKKDIKGYRRVPRISYTDTYGQHFELSSFQEYDDGSFEHYNINQIQKFASSIDTLSENELITARFYTSYIIQFLNEYNLMGIQSQKHLGEYIEFKIGLGCSVWYKDEEAKLNTSMEKSFKNAYKIKPNWYILPWTEESLQIIERYKEKLSKRDR